MRIEEVDKWGMHIKKYYMYRSDLEKFDTRRLLFILRCLRSVVHCLDWDYFELMKPGESVENTWFEYQWVEGGGIIHQYQYYAMIWMVKDVLSRREHIPTSKIECRKIRQSKAKNRNDRKCSTHFCGRNYSRS